MNDPMRHPGVARQRCGRCGRPVPAPPETDLRVEVPQTLLGFPVVVVCEECLKLRKATPPDVPPA